MKSGREIEREGVKEKVCYILVVHYPRQLGIKLPFAGYTFKVLLRLRFHRTNTAPNRKGNEGGGGDSAGMVGGTIDRLVDGKTV